MTILQLPSPNTPILDYRRLRENAGLWKDEFDPRTLAPSQEWYAALQKISIAAASFPFYNALDWGILGDGNDHSAEIQTAINEIYAAGGGYLWLPYGEIGFSSTINVLSGVYLFGQGKGVAYRVGTGTFGTSKYGTRLVWGGTPTGTTPGFDFGDGTTILPCTSAGLINLSINMGAPNWRAVVDGGDGTPPTSSHRSAVRSRNAWGLLFRDVAIDEAGRCFEHINTIGGMGVGTKPSVLHQWDHCTCYNSFKGWEFSGDHTAHPDGTAVANSRMSWCVTKNMEDSAVDVIQHSDNVYYFGCEFVAHGAGGSAIRINRDNESITTNQIGNHQFIGCLTYVEHAATSAMIINDMTGACSYDGAHIGTISGTGIAKTKFSEMGNNRKVDIYTGYAADALVMGTSTTFAGNLALRMPVDFQRYIVPADPLLSVNGLLTLFAKKIYTVVHWAPQSASASSGVRMILAGTATVVAGPVFPSNAALQETIMDFTTYAHANLNSTVGAAFKPNLQLQTAGDGGTAPSVYRWDVRVETNG